jgi:hypothetical protein
MTIRMLSTTPGSVDGIRVATYEAGVEYALDGSSGEQELARAFVDAGLAEQVGAESTTGPDTAAAGASASAKPGRKPKAS